MFEVIKEYAGIKVGEIVKSKDRSTERYMIDNGYWIEVKIKPIKAKIEPELKQRLKKVERVTRNKK